MTERTPPKDLPTTGPWEWRGDQLYAPSAGVTLLRDVTFWNIRQEDKALIAAASEMYAALSAIEDMASGEIRARFGNSTTKTADEVGKNSAVYHLLVLPRDIARHALKCAERILGEHVDTKGE